MSFVFNAGIMLFSLCIVLLMVMKQMSIGTYLILIMIEYLVILVSRSAFRKATKRFFVRRGKFGEESKHYKAVHLETLRSDLEQMEPIPFEYFIRDLFKAEGYVVKTTPDTKDFGADVIARKGKEVIAIQVKHRNSQDWLVSNDAVQQVVAAMAIYKANCSMVVTNGTFTEHALNQAQPNSTLMIDGVQLEKMIRNRICHADDSKAREDLEEQGAMESVPVEEMLKK